MYMWVFGMSQNFLQIDNSFEAVELKNHAGKLKY